MTETKEEISIKIKTKRLNMLVDEMYCIFESVYEMLKAWKREYHLIYVSELVRLQQLEEDIMSLGYDDGFVLTIKQVIYSSVFGNRK